MHLEDFAFVARKEQWQGTRLIWSYAITTTNEHGHQTMHVEVEVSGPPTAIEMDQIIAIVEEIEGKVVVTDEPEPSRVFSGHFPERFRPPPGITPEMTASADWPHPPLSFSTLATGWAMGHPITDPWDPQQRCQYLNVPAGPAIDAEAAERTEHMRAFFEAAGWTRA